MFLEIRNPKTKAVAGLYSFWRSRGEFISLLFLPSGGHLHPLAHGPVYMKIYIHIYAHLEKIHFKEDCCHCCLVTKLCPTFVIPWNVACQAPLSMGFSRQDYWSRLPFPSSGALPNPGSTWCALASRFFTSHPSGKPLKRTTLLQN